MGIEGWYGDGRKEIGGIVWILESLVEGDWDAGQGVWA